MQGPAVQVKNVGNNFEPDSIHSHHAVTYWCDDNYAGRVGSITAAWAQ